MATLLSGFGFRGFRSFHGEVQTVSPLSKINLIAGQNNSGKSNVLLVAQRLQTLQRKPPSDLDLPRVLDPPSFDLVIRVGDIEEVAEKLCTAIDRKTSQAIEAVTQLLRVPAIDRFEDGGACVWFSDSQGSDVNYRLQAKELLRPKAIKALSRYTQIRNFVGGNAEHSAVDCIGQLAKVIDLPRVRMVEASRRIEDEDNGVSLIQRLAALERPELNNDDDRQQFEAINEFLRTVIDDPTARLEIPHTARQINVRRQGLLLPLSNLGTGVFPRSSCWPRLPR